MGTLSQYLLRILEFPKGSIKMILSVWEKRFPSSGLSRYVKFLFPLFWPKEHLRLQLLVILSFLTVILGCVVNLSVPIYNQKIVDSLSKAFKAQHNHIQVIQGNIVEPESSEFALTTVLIFIGLKVLQGVGTLSLINCTQSFIWIQLEQHVRKEVQVRFFEHLHKMSVRWQLGKKTGEILGSLERGTSGVISLLEQSLYSVLPTLADIIIAVIYLSTKFNIQIGLIVLAQVGLYLHATVKITRWRQKFQVDLHNAEDKQRQQAMESLLNFETVKYFANEKYETQKYSQVIDHFHTREFRVLASINFMQLVQLTIVNLGLLIGSLVIVWMILYENEITVGGYVLFASYMTQLIRPLNYLGTHYRTLNENVINMNEILKMLERNPEIKTNPKSEELTISEGVIEFKNVAFSYNGPDKQALKDISFSIQPKKTVALVGHSGSGKSSIIRLLTRLYDVNSGEILIDGQNIAKVFPEGLRKAIGVVPQETILFHDTIGNNIRYGKLDATMYEVQLAAQYAQIHEKIASLPQGYDTIVGERGLTLSGGEKQRVAIARMFLKNPPIILLDEATSALDVNTEQEIFSSFQKLFRNRTCLVVTHRLQSIQHLDEILVLKNGRILERGSHTELLRNCAEYASMWNQQNKAI